jgi:hypothetical protein
VSIPHIGSITESGFSHLERHAYHATALVMATYHRYFGYEQILASSNDYRLWPVDLTRVIRLITLR